MRPMKSKLLGVIKAVKAGKQGAGEQKDYAAVAQHLRQAGAEALLVACTELSVLTLPDMGCPVVDTLDVLVEATIDAAGGVTALLVKPTGAGLGAEISNVDLRKLDDRQFGELHRAWLQNLVLLVRDQQLTDADLINFSRRFGDLDWAPVQETGRRFVEGLPEIYVVSNVLENGEPIGSLGSR